MKIPYSEDQIIRYAPVRERGILYVFDRKYEGDEEADLIAFVYGYFAEERRYPVVFCRPFPVKKSWPVSVIGDAFRNAYNTEDNEPVQIYEVRSQTEVVEIKADKLSSTFTDLAISSGITFVVQVSNSQPIERSMSSSEEEGDEPEVCSFLACNGFPLKFDQFVAISNETAVTIEFENERRPAKFSFGLDIDSIISFLLRHVFSDYHSKINHDFEQPKCFVLYCPRDMQCLSGKTLAEAMNKKDGSELQLRYYEGMTAGYVAKSYRIIPWYSYNGFTTIRDRMPILCHKSCTVGELKDTVFQSNYFDVESPRDLRVCEIRRGLIFRILGNDVELRDYKNPFRIEAIPPEQRGTPPSSRRIIQIVTGDKLSEKFSLVRLLRAGETVGELKSWLAELLSQHIAPEFWDSCSVEFKRRSTTFLMSFLKDKDVIKEMIGDNPFIYIKRKDQKSSTRRDHDPSDSVKIHN